VAAVRRARAYRSVPRRSRALLIAAGHLGDTIAKLRKKRELTQQKAAELAELETKHWQLLERGGTNPTLATLLAVAKALDVELYELLK
jgi:transcriptional regulator with XRE-family HTH domain